MIKNAEGMTAEEKIQVEGDFTTVADYLREARTRGSAENGSQNAEHPPPLPPNVKIHLGTLEDEQSLGEVADPELKQRIEDLAARENFEGEAGQKQLRDLITDAVRGVGGDDRNVRPRAE